MSEATVQAGIATALRAMTEFADADVTVNDWSILDNASSNGPYVIIETSATFSNEQHVTPIAMWSIPITLYQPFVNWSTSLTAFGATRQAIIDKINSNNIRSAGGLAGVNLLMIKSDGAIDPVYDIYVENPNEATPIFLAQRIVLECREF